jgi:hypothetical protein
MKNHASQAKEQARQQKQTDKATNRVLARQKKSCTKMVSVPNACSNSATQCWQEADSKVPIDLYVV